jgi:putative inorganic carbon (hco3(-)) transporter
MLMILLALGIAVTAAFFAWRKPVFGVSLAIFMLPFDWPVRLGALTVYSNEWLLLGLCAGWAARWARHQTWQQTRWGDFLWAVPFLGAVLLSGINALAWSSVFKQFLRYAQMVLLAAYTAQAGLTEKEILEQLRLYMVMALVAAGIGIFQSLAGPSAALNAGREAFTLYDGHVMRAYGPIGHPNQLAGYLILILPAAVVDIFYVSPGRRRWGSLALAAVLLAALAMTFSRGAWLGLAVTGLGLFVFLVPRVWFWRGLILGGLVMGLGYGGMKLFPGPGVLVADRLNSMQHPQQEDSVNFRKVCLETAVKMIRVHPWLGYGAGEYQVNIRKYFDEKYYAWSAMNKHIHNLYAQIAMESGLLGLGGFLIWLGYWLWVPGKRLLAFKPGLPRSYLAASLAGIVAFFLHNHFDVLTIFARGTHAALVMGLAMALAFLQPEEVS